MRSSPDVRYQVIMAKKKVAKKAKVAAKPAKGSSKKKTAPAKKTSVKAKTKAKAVPAKKAAKPAKKAAAKTVKKVAAKPDRISQTVSVRAKKVASKPVKKAAAKPAKKVVAIAKPVPAKSKPAASKVKSEGELLAESIVRGILEKKGQNVQWLDLRGIENAVCDHFIICEGGSNTQVEAIADSVEDTVKAEMSQRPFRSEGWENALWILIDYVDVVVHVFERETRHFYNLESLWADAEEIKVKQ